MPITKVTNVVTEVAVKDMDQFLRTGVIHDSEFALCDEADRLKQIQFNATPMASNTTLVIAAGASSSGTFTLPNVAGGILGLQGEIYQYAAPTTGSTVTFATGQTTVVLEPAGTIAALTLVLPTAPNDGWLINFSSTQIITALTLSGGGSDTIANAITTLAANGFAAYVYRAANTKWYRIG